MSMHPFVSAAMISLVIFLFTAVNLHAQNYRFSLGYSVQQYGLDISQNPSFGGDLSFTQKGNLELELERYFWHRFYYSIHGDYLLHNQESIFLSGPVNFNRATTGINLGLQWSRVGVYSGVHSGSFWNMRFKGILDEDETAVWIQPEGSGNSFSLGYTIGAKYYLFKYLRLDARYRFNRFQNNTFTARNVNGQTPQASEIKINPSTFTFGVTVSIPWRNRGTSSRNRPRRGPSSDTPIMSTEGLSFSSPVSGNSIITSPFGQRWTRQHEGIDLDAKRGDSILAAADGVVIEARNSRGYGRMVVIRHGTEYTTLYAHLDRVRVREGQRVQRGQVIGTAGDSGVATGVHLHFEIRRDGHPVDPAMYIRF
jgi:murein DD-endopeptidase MepM/ murein hydrolase activator NlpD